jgi:hypothetical protein
MKYEMKWRVDVDGVLRFALEMGTEYANKCVSLTVASVEPPPDTSPLTDGERGELIADLEVKWRGDFPSIPRGRIMRAGDDGVLRLPLGEINAHKQAYVTVEVLQPTDEVEAQERAERRRFIEEMAGKITDPTFVRHPQGEYEPRDEL